MLNRSQSNNAIGVELTTRKVNYPVIVSRDLEQSLRCVWQPSWHEAVVISDANVCRFYGQALVRHLSPLTDRVELYDFPPGERHKSRQTKKNLEDKLLDAGFDRRACIVALGGGISLDVAGFVAATYMRGIAHLNVPTTLLAQVDAAIGGKTGVNCAQGKNLIGTIHQPRAVIINSDYLATLPAVEWSNGLAELIKHAVIQDEKLFQWLELHTQQLAQPGAIEDYPLRRCVEIKGRVVELDEHEQGLRSILNFGHTVGHALEKASQHALGHGHAVAIGMVVEAEIACALTGFPAEAAKRLRQLMVQLGLPVAPPPLSFAELVHYMGFDKKRRGGQIYMALPTRLGAMATGGGSYTIAVSEEQIQQAWASTSPNPA